MFKSGTIILINVVGLIVLLGATVLIVSRLPVVANHSSHSSWGVFFIIFMVFSVIGWMANKRRKAQLKATPDTTNRDGGSL
jgi:uncharacterized protein YacL